MDDNSPSLRKFRIARALICICVKLLFFLSHASFCYAILFSLQMSHPSKWITFLNTSLRITSSLFKALVDVWCYWFCYILCKERDIWMCGLSVQCYVSCGVIRCRLLPAPKDMYRCAWLPSIIRSLCDTKFRTGLSLPHQIIIRAVSYVFQSRGKSTEQSSVYLFPEFVN